MKRAARLVSARHWLATQQGRTPRQITASYRKRYGVDWECAIRELAALGVRLNQDWVAQLRQSLERAYRTAARREAERELRALWNKDSDETFAYIAGYTAGGAPYGVTWEEWRNLEAEEKVSASLELPSSGEPFVLRASTQRRTPDKDHEANELAGSGIDIPF